MLTSTFDFPIMPWESLSTTKRFEDDTILAKLKPSMCPSTFVHTEKYDANIYYCD